jgi:glutathione peroxidase
MNKIMTLIVGLFLLSLPALAQESQMSKPNAYQFSFKGLDGKDIQLSQFKGKAILIVNTASECGFAKQITDLESLYQKYKDKGLVVIAVPEGDFGDQQPGTDAEIKENYSKNFGATYILTSKTHVKGDDAHSFYKWAAEQTSFLGVPKWNFHKYLISPDGDFVDYFNTTTSPTSKSITDAIEKSLNKTN